MINNHKNSKEWKNYKNIKFTVKISRSLFNLKKLNITYVLIIAILFSPIAVICKEGY